MGKRSNRVNRADRKTSEQARGQTDRNNAGTAAGARAAGSVAGGDPLRIASEPGKRVFWVGLAVSFLASFALYLKTMAATSSFWDSGEYIASAYTLGIPHSPGTPLYVLVGRVFTLLPFPFYSIAERVNLLSAFCGAVGVAFVFVLIVRFLDYIMGKTATTTDAVVKVVGGLVGAFFIAASDTYWIDSTEAEVYAMSNALMGFMTWLGLKWGDKSRDVRSTFLIYLLFYLLALSVGFHLGTILAISGIFFFVLMTREKLFSNLEFIVACAGVAIFVADATLYRDGRITMFLLVVYVGILLWLWASKRRFPVVAAALFVLGLSVHLYLMIRSGHNPNIDEGDPETWRSLYFALRREQYPPMNVFARKAGIVFQLTHFNNYFQAQFQMAAAYVGKLNLGSIIPFALGIWGMVDQYTKNRKTFVMLFVTFVTVSLGLIVFLNFSDEEVRERDYFYSPAFYYFAVYIGIGAASLLGELKNLLTRRRAAEAPAVYAFAVVLLALPFFTMRHHYFTHDRSRDFTCPAYARNMLVGLEPNAVLFTNGDNDTFPLWYIQEVENYRRDVKVVNLSLLNTPWYIKQCRDNEPKAPVGWTDEQIDRLTPVPTKDGWLLVRDLAAQQILRANEWRQPIYFAVTIPSQTFEPYQDILEFEGLAYLVVRRKGENMINVEKLEENVLKNYKYTNILDENWKRDKRVYLPSHVEHLIQNYAAAFVQLAFVKHRAEQYREATRNLEIAMQIAPDYPPPVQLLGWYYLDAGDTAKAVGFYQDQIAKRPDDLDTRFRLAGVYERTGETLKAVEQLDLILKRNPEDREAAMAAFGLALRAGDVERSRKYLVDWLTRHPEDGSAKKTLADLDRELGGLPQPPE